MAWCSTDGKTLKAETRKGSVIAFVEIDYLGNLISSGNCDKDLQRKLLKEIRSHL